MPRKQFSPDGNNETYHVRAVTRALDLVIALSEGPTSIGLVALAESVALPPSTAFRLLESLKSRGFVRQTAGGTYELGSRAFEVGSAFLRQVSLWSQATEIAEHLADYTQETASVGILDEGQVLYIAIARGQSEIGIQSAAGTRHPVHCTSLGKVLLADLAWPQVQQVLKQRPPVRFTSRTLIEADGFRRELEHVRVQGFALDEEERTPGVICIGAPLRDHTGRVVGAVSISGPAFRMRERGVPDMAKQVMARAEEASRHLAAPTPKKAQER